MVRRTIRLSLIAVSCGCTLQGLAHAEEAGFALGANANDTAIATSTDTSAGTAGASAAPAPVNDNREPPTTGTNRALPETGFEYGLRVGLELPLGQIDKGASIFGGAIQTRSGDLDGVAKLSVPLTLDLGYRADARWWWGLEAGAATGPVGGDCISGASCEWAALRLAAQTIYRFSSDSQGPWIGLGLGYEWFRGSVSQVISLSDDPNASTAAVKAREYLGGPKLEVLGGLDFELSEHLRLGPYAAGSLGVYLRDLYECPSALLCPTDKGVDDPRLHAWLGLGVRAVNGP
ncbi:MAG TPA: hypothetical protein VHM70_04250 [Polyangiaceae bacterium]|nr:hypothetical protein [Polyangiaceae bacterium]